MSNRILVKMIQELFPNNAVVEVTAFPVLHQGWECDEWGYKVRLENMKHPVIIFTSHGSHYLPDRREIEEKLREYTDAMFELELALEQSTE